jgi:UDP-N-acetylglucosamine--N-acetylmuramyl-(pentapeptide) pyrophosphoryl-undecaprenol N-acetylglucosamine transferase
VKIIVTGGGTGGHVFPAIAVAEALQRLRPEAEILFVGGGRGLEATAVPQAGFAFRTVPARSLRGRRAIGLPAALWVTLQGLIHSLRIVRQFRPDVVFATGGYVSGPVALAAALLGRPVVLHEQNTVPGLTNRLLARVAREVHVSDPGSRRHFPKRRHLKLSGNPIRGGVLQGDHQRALREWRMERERRTVLILGGSQGARSINRAAVGAVRRLAGRPDLQFVLQTGPRDHDWVARKLQGVALPARVIAFIQNMGDAYRAADLVVARSGAMTLAELAVCGRAAILVPFPYSAGNHQELNARTRVEAGAAEMILDRELSGRRLAAAIVKMIDTPRKLREMSHNALRGSRPDAAQKIAAALLRCATGAVDTSVEEEPPARREGRR